MRQAPAHTILDYEVKQVTELEKRYFAETVLVLRRESFWVEHLQDGTLNVVLDGQPLCEVNKIVGITYRDVVTPEQVEAKDKAFRLICTIAEYMRQMERAPPLLKDRYRVLADFNGTVLACMAGKSGVEFVTCDFNRGGVSHGHYFGRDCKGAKQDFAICSGLIPGHIFTDEQLIEIYRRCADTLDAGLDLTYDQEKCIWDVQDQIESDMPDIMLDVLITDIAGESPDLMHITPLQTADRKNFTLLVIYRGIHKLLFGNCSCI